MSRGLLVKSAALCGAAAVVAVLTSGLSGSPPGESPAHYQEEVAPGAARAAASAPVRFEEPGSAAAAGAPESPAVARAVARLRAQAAPADEVFALVRLTDRRTGQRREFTRGKASAELLDWLADPESIPSGLALDEGDSAHADDEVEVVVRAIRALAVPAGAAGPTRAEEEEEDLREIHGGGGLSHRIRTELRRRVDEGDIDLGGGELVPVVIALKGIPRLRLPKVNDLVESGLIWTAIEAAAAREDAIISRKKMMPELQRSVVDSIEDAGGNVRYASWASGAIEALVPAWVIPKLAEHPSVFSIEYNAPGVEAGMWGGDYFILSDAENFDAFHSGWHGLTSRHSFTPRVVLGMSEKCIDQGHPGWLNAGGAETRGFFYDCDGPSACRQGGLESCSVSIPHGTQVAGLMTADFMDGQGTFPDGVSRRSLTGVCPECRFFFLQDQGLDQRGKAHDAACDLGVDIFESSIVWIVQSCNGEGAWGPSVKSLIDCGAVYVQAAGNYGSTGSSCTTRFPADDPWTLAVSGVDTTYPCDTPGAWYTDDCQISDASSRGGANYSGPGTASVIDLAAPYNLANLLRPAVSPVWVSSGGGTSYATPIVAGLTAEMMDWYKVHIGTGIFYNNRARNFMLLFGDRSSGRDGTAKLIDDTSVFWGAGRVGLVPFDSKPFWDVERRGSVLARNATWTFTIDINPAATFFKAVVWHDGTNYTNEPLIRLSLDPIGCSNATRSVDRLDDKVPLVFTTLSGCTGMNVSITNVGQGFSGTRGFHFASYTDTEDEEHY